MTGAELDALILAAARCRRLQAFHFPDSRLVTAAGWPDWVLIGPRGILFREAKGRGDTVSREQRAVGYALEANGLDWAVWPAREPAIANIIGGELEAIAAPLKEET